MHTHHVEALDSTLHKTHLWLNEILQELGWENPHWAFAALRGVLHSLRDRLPVDEAAQLGAQLPMLVRGLYYEGWKPSGKPLSDRSLDHFYTSILSAFGDTALVDIVTRSEVGAQQVAKAVMRVLSRHTTESFSVRRLLPAHVRTLWPDAASA